MAGLDAITSGGAMGGPTTAGALVVSPTTIVATLGPGIVVTVVSALLPARRAARVAPVAAMSSVDAPATQRSLVVRNSVGLALDSFFGLTTVLPFGQLAGYLLGGILVGLLAALWPARRAVRMGVLDGIRSA